MTTVNLGILAHVDAGKTSLTERLLYDAGVIHTLGSVDDGSTRTDALSVERRRGITVSSGVVSFPAGDRTVNLIDTPGHADFVAEVERALGVLDGAVLVVSATGGVQAGTRLLLRKLRELGVPTLILVNKADQSNAGWEGLLPRLRQLCPGLLPMVTVRGCGTPQLSVRARSWDEGAALEAAVETLAERDEGLLESYVTGTLEPGAVRAALETQTARAEVQPVYCGSATIGAGIAELVRGVVELLPAAELGGELCGTVFTVERVAGGARVALVRLHGGAVRVRDRVTLSRRADDGSVQRQQRRVTGLQVGAEQTGCATAGQIVRLWGLRGVRVDDRLGDPAGPEQTRVFPPPALASLVTVEQRADRPRLQAALRELADRDPLIGLCGDEESGELSVRTYGDVQREVIRERLREEFGIVAHFRPSVPLRTEQPVGTGEAVHQIADRAPAEPWATVGLRVEPGPSGSGIRYGLAVERGSLPRAFRTAIEETVHRTARRGPHGHEVTDCRVTLTSSGFADPISTAGDFRQVTERLFTLALERAGTEVYEPVDRFEVELPEPDAGAAAAVAGRLGGSCEQPVVEHGTARLTGLVPAVNTPRLRSALLELGHGEADCVTEPAGYRPDTATRAPAGDTGRGTR